MSVDYTRLVKELFPETGRDGEPTLHLRTMVVAAVNSDGTVDLTTGGGGTVPGVARLDGAAVVVGGRVQVLAGRGVTLVLGPVAVAPVGFTSRVAAVKPASTGRNSTTTLAADPDITGIRLGVGTWRVVIEGGLAGGSGGVAVKTQWSFSGTWSNPTRWCDGPTSGNTTAGNGNISRQHTAYAAGTNCIYGLGTGAASCGFREWSSQVEVTVAGDFSLQWAPNASNGNNNFVALGTTCLVQRVA
jgi:hypothetical protein